MMKGMLETKPTKFTEHPQCPRCGYDLGGLVSLWEEAGCCRLEGRCSECGLGFEWGLIFADSEHPWVCDVHHLKKRWRRLFKTIMMTFWPWRFWREVAMTDKVSMIRLLAIPLILFGILLGFQVLANEWWSHQSDWLEPNPLVWIEVARWGFQMLGSPPTWSSAWNGDVTSIMNGVLLAIVLWCALMVMSFGLLPHSMRQARVAKRHLWRVAVYTYVPLVPYFIIWIFLDLIMYGLAKYTGSILFVEFWRWQMLGCSVVPVIGWFIWQLTCWTIACDRYLKLPHSFGIAFLLSVASGLLIAVVGVLWYNYSLVGSF